MGKALLLLLLMTLPMVLAESPTLSFSPTAPLVGEEIEVLALPAGDYAAFVLEIQTPTATLKYLPPDGTLAFPVTFRPSEVGSHNLRLVEKSTGRVNSNQPFTVFPAEESANTSSPIELENSEWIRLKDSRGRNVRAFVRLSRDATTVYDSATDRKPVEIGRYDAELRPNVEKFVRIRLTNLSVNGSMDLGIERLSKELLVNGSESVEAFAIDPTGLAFDSGLVTRVATGTELWKCKEWNFSTQTCYGTWLKLMDLAPGSEYTFLLTPQDPGFVETGQADFDNGTYNGTFFNTSGNFVQLNASFSNGSFTSQIFDAGGNATWDNISWVSNALGALPVNAAIEAIFARGNMDMTGNLLLYRMDEQGPDSGPGGHDFEDFSGQQNHANESGNVTFGSAGKVASALTFDEIDDYLNISDFDYGPAFSVAFWLKPTDNNGTNFQYFFSHGNSSVTNSINIFMTEDGNLQNYIRTSLLDASDLPGASTLDITNGTSLITDGGWHHYTLTVESGNATVYIDGINRTTSGSGGGSFDPATNLFLGARNDLNPQRSYGGSLDEVALWNRTLSSQEVADIYERGLLRLNLTARSCDDPNCTGEGWIDLNDSSPQLLTILPSNQYFQYGFNFETDNTSFTPELYNVTINYSVDLIPPGSVTGLANQSAGDAWIYWNWTNPVDADFNRSIVHINGSNVANTTANFHNATGLACGVNYNITVHTRDHAGNVNDTDVWDLGITNNCTDITPPGSVMALDNQSSGTTWIYWNWTNPGDPDFNVAVIYLNGSLQTNTSNNFFNATGLNINATYVLTVHTKDANGNVNNTDVNDTGATIPDVVYPTASYIGGTADDNDYRSATWIFINITAFDDHEENVTFSLFNSSGLVNLTVFGAGNRSINFTGLAEGTYYYNVTVNDTSGNTNVTATRTITLDTTLPTVNYISPTPPDNSNQSSTTLDVNVSHVETNPATIILYVNGVPNQTKTYGGSFTNFSVQNLSDGNYTYYVWLNDSAGSENQTVTRTVRIDATPPNITLLGPNNGSADADGEVSFTANVTDDSIIANCSILLQGSVNETNTTIASGGITSFDLFDLTVTRYNWSIRCFDSLGNQQDSEQRHFDVILMTNFGPASTNLSLVDPENITNFTLDLSLTGRLQFNGTINLSGGADLDSLITISQNLISVDSASDPRFDRAATLTLRGLSFAYEPIMLLNSSICSPSICSLESYAGGNLTFNVTGFTSYSSTTNSEITIWDSTDPEEGSQEKYIHDDILFFANYSNRTSGNPINGAGIGCNVSFDLDGWTTPVSMTYNGTSQLYEYNRSFDDAGLLTWNVSCVGTALGYENISTLDFVAVRPLDYFVQSGNTTIPTGQSSVTIQAGIDYEVPSSLGNSFIRIVGTRLSGVGHDSGGGTQDPDEFMASVEDPGNLLTSITFRRYSTTGSFNTRIYWEIIEYTGQPGGINEMIVRDQAEISQSSGTTLDGAAAAGVQNDSRIVVFITGQRHNAAGDSSSIDQGLYTAAWLNATDVPRFTRGDGTGASSLSYTVVEFTGDNWRVQRVNHSYGGTSEETENITAVASMAKTFIHPQLRTESGNLDEQGQRVWLSANDTVSFELDGGGVFNRVGVAWVIENTLTTGILPNAQRVSNTRSSGGGEPDEWPETIGAVQRTFLTSIMGETATSTGGGSQGPRGPIGLQLANLTSVNLWRSDTGQTQTYSFEVWEWPTAVYNFAPSTPTAITCDGSSNCDIEIDTGVSIQANGSTDYENDSITYHIEVSLGNTTVSPDLEAGEIQLLAIGQSSTTVIDDDFTVDSGLWAYTGSCGRVTGDANCNDGDACIRCFGASGAGEDGTAISTNDLTLYDSCLINFNYRANSLDNGGECGRHRYFDTSEHDVLTICDPDDTDLWTNDNYNYTGLGYTLESESEVKYSIEGSGGGDNWYIDNVNLTCYNADFQDDSTNETEYQDVASGPYANLDNITITVQISLYNNSGSSNRSNNDADLRIDLYNGTGWVSVGTLGVGGTGNISVTTTSPVILQAWQDAANRDVRITGVNFDYVSPAILDAISWTGVWTNLEGKGWIEVGTHLDGSSFFWNTTTIEEQTCIDIRSRAIDPLGSNEYSSYFTKGSCLNITHPTNITGAALNVTTLNQTHSVMLTANITDSQGVAAANATLQYPNGTRVNLTMVQGSGVSWHVNFSDTNNTGVYGFTQIYTWDTANNSAVFNFSDLNFTVVLSPPSPFDLVSPTNGTVSANLIPTMTWNQSSDEHFANYTLLFDQDAGFGSPDYSYSTSPVTNTTKTLDFALDANVIYYWRVIAYDIFSASTNSTQDYIYITDTIAPAVSLNTPENNTYINSAVAIFNFTPSDTNSIANCTLYTNLTGSMTPNATNTTINNGQPNYIYTSLPDGFYRWGVACADVAGNTNTSFIGNNRTVIVDLTPPEIVILAPPNNTLENTTNNVRFTVNTSDVLANVSSCDLLINGVPERTETDITDGVAFNFTHFLLNGNYNWSVQCTDENGHANVSGIYNLSVLVVDTNPPLVTLYGPDPDQFLSQGNISFNYTPEDATGIENCSIFINSTLNDSDVAVENFIPNYFNISFPDGPYSWLVQCYDNSTDFNLGVSETRNFTVDTLPPTVFNLTFPPNSTSPDNVIKYNYTLLNWTATTELNFRNYTVLLDDDENFSSPAYAYTAVDIANVSINATDLADGLFYWLVIASDQALNTRNSSETFAFRISTQAPNFTATAENPADPVVYSPGALYVFNATVEDYALNTVLFENNFSGVLVNTTVTNIITSDNHSHNVTINFTGLDAGTYQYRWLANDSINVFGNTSVFTYIIEKDNGSVDLLLNGTSANLSMDEDGNANITGLLLTPSSGNITLFLDGTVINNGTAPLTNITFFSEPGAYNVTLAYSESTNYNADSETHFIIVNDTTAPIVTLIFPGIDEIVGTNNIVLQYNVTDSTTVANCSLYINSTFNQTETNITRNITETFSEFFPDGNYSWQVQCYDQAGNLGVSATNDFDVFKTNTTIVEILTDNASYEEGAIANVTVNTTDVFGNPLGTNVTSDIILGISNYSWWNVSWQNRKQILVTNELAFSRNNTPIVVNVTGLGGNITTCADEIRVVNGATLESIAVNILSGDDDTYCDVLFLADLNANATTVFHVYYNNPSATDPGAAAFNLTVTLMSEDFSNSSGIGGWNTSTDNRCDYTTPNPDCSDNSPWGSFNACEDGGDYELCTVAYGATVQQDPSDYALTMQDMDGFDPTWGVIMNFTNLEFLCDGNACNQIGVTFDFTAASLDAPGGNPEFCRVWANDVDTTNATVYHCSDGDACEDGDSTPEPSDYDTIGPVDVCSLAGIDCQTGGQVEVHFGGGGPGTGGGNGDWCFYDNVLIEGTKANNSNVSISLGNQELHITRSQGETDISGIYSYTFNTSNRTLGNYSAVAFATKVNFSLGMDGTQFEIRADTTPPNVTLLLPVDFHEQGVGFVNFTYHVYDINLQSCTLYFGKDGAFDPNETAPSPVNNASNGFNNIYFDLGLWSWNIFCNDSAGNSGFAPANFTLNITGPDLFPSALYFDTSTFIEGLNITIFANVTNNGLAAASENFLAQFYLGDPDTNGTQINGNITISSLAINETVTVNVSHILLPGTNNIFVRIDGNDTINESDESNNDANQSIVVSLYHRLYGNISTGVRLDTVLNASLKTFGNETNRSGHVFISDTDSAFSFVNLAAVTRTTTGTPTADDLSDADSLLGTSSFNDSVRQVWGNGTDTPIATETINLSSGPIANVPIVNSTNSSTFITGLLWDADDDDSANLQFDTTDAEDLVFVTRINESGMGLYGIYDYEIRVPALLRNFTGTTDTVTIYVEII